ncbi:MAG: hypothetical protein PHD72_03950 [Patescibacteria group bacterium]|nr:hypothetical protein [Patescibacteria group bacterium]
MGNKATATALTGLVNDLADEQLLALTDSANRRALKKFLHEMIVSPAKKSGAKSAARSAELVEWTKFYQKVFALTVNLSKVKLRPKTKDFDGLVVVAKELGDKPLARVLDACERLFPTSFNRNITAEGVLAAARTGGRLVPICSNRGNDDLDQFVPTNDRDPRITGSYAIRIRDRVEADEENEDISANDAKLRNIATMTLMERCLLEAFYFWKRNKINPYAWDYFQHLDREDSRTLCSGSRRSDGNVPYCTWGNGKFFIQWVGPDDAGGVRPRSVVI